MGLAGKASTERRVEERKEGQGNAPRSKAFVEGIDVDQEALKEKLSRYGL